MFRWGKGSKAKPRPPSAAHPPRAQVTRNNDNAGPPLPDEDTLNGMFGRLLEDLAIPASKRGAMMKQPKALKWKLICTHQARPALHRHRMRARARNPLVRFAWWPLTTYDCAVPPPPPNKQ